MKVSIIIINYNLTAQVKECIQSIFNIVNSNDYEIVLVDNNSDDKEIVELSSNFSKILGNRLIFLELDRNYGFGNACNRAVEKARGELLFFLNPDTIIFKDFLNNITDFMNSGKTNVGIVGLNVSAEKKIDYSAGYFPNLLFEILNIISLGRYTEALIVKIKTILSKTKKIKVDWVMGASLFIKKKLFVDIGGFAKEYFLYFEEMDLCRRVKEKKQEIIYCADIEIKHIGSVSTKKNYYFFTKMFYKGRLIFLKKHFPNKKNKLFISLTKLHIYFQILIWIFLKNRYADKSNGKLKAFNEVLKNINNPQNISNNLVSN